MPLDPTPPLERPIPPARDWLTAPRKDLITHIVTHHHGFAREELTRLTPLVAEACAQCQQSHPELAEVRIHFHELVQDLRSHFQMEERNLFPAICAMDDGAAPPISLGSPREQLSTIHAEHQAVEELFLNIRMLTSDYGLKEGDPAVLCDLYHGLRALEDDLHIHLYLENHLLFPRALQGAQW